jgi:hypothetical protein
MLSDLNEERLHWIATAPRGTPFPIELGFSSNEWDTPLRELAIAVMRELAELEQYQQKELNHGQRDRDQADQQE